MKRYKIKIEEVRITEFDVNAKNRNEVKEIVKDILFKTNILNLSCVGHKHEIRLDVESKGNK